MAESGTASVTSVAGEVVQRLSAVMGIPFTLTDEVGVVLASTGGHPRGQVDAGAVSVIVQGEPVEFAGEPEAGREATPAELDAPPVSDGGFLANEPGVYLPFRVGGRLGGVLIAHGAPEEVRTQAQAAAAIVGVALEFARGASLSARQSPGPDLALHQLLRGSPREARRAALVAKVVGWDLSVPRVAIAVMADETADGTPRPLDPSLFPMVAEFVDTVAPGTPLGQLNPGEWALLPALPEIPHRPTPRQLAEDIRSALLGAGATAVLGLGDSHAERSLPAVRRSYREAVFSARLGVKLDGAKGVYQLNDLGAAGFLAPHPATRRRLARRLLQPLRAQPEVLDSVLSFLEADLSLTAAARATGLHRHTIRSHLERVRDTIGLDPRSLDDALQLRLALLLERLDGLE